MRIAMLAPIAWRVPPRGYGPWERLVGLLMEGLVARGVDVTLFATADSLTSAQLATVCPRPYGEDPAIDAKVWECLHIVQVFERADKSTSSTTTSTSCRSATANWPGPRC